ncbi:MAG: AraC family transcriptional regulator, partial [Lachnospiraceae bacterium]|nr:AraC family transcriptional regulator [Lachnospiraceae bacterium]
PNQLHFSRAFKNVYGISPRQWRNENGGGRRLTE